MTEYRIAYGKGSLIVNLGLLLPAKIADFKKLIRFVALSPDPDKARELYDYIIDRLEKSKTESEIKRLFNHAAALRKSFNMEGNEMKEYSITPAGIIGQFENDKVTYYRPGESGYAAALIAANQERTAAGKDVLIPAGIDPETEKAVRAALDGVQIEPETDQAAPEMETETEAPDQIESDQAAPETEADQTESKTDQAATETETDQIESDQAETEPEKPACAVPEKSFIGTTITGRGFRIYFDPAAGKTRVIFDRVPPVATRDAVKAAGFWWSPALKSWNKGLTWKAYRAAIRLVDQLSAT